MSKEEFSGLILYTIELDGCLNGLYTNNKVDGEILNEIAKRKHDSPTKNTDTIIGTYDCVFFEANKPFVQANLVINIEQGTARTYTFDWIKLGKSIFKGRGYKISHNQIIVHYW